MCCLHYMNFRPQGYKAFFMFDSAEYEISTAHDNYNNEEQNILLADVVFILLINVRISRINAQLSWALKSFIALGPDLQSIQGFNFMVWIHQNSLFDTHHFHPHDHHVDENSVCQKVSMIRKYHNHKLQTNPRHCEEEPQNIYSNKTSERQLEDLKVLKRSPELLNNVKICNGQLHENKWSKQWNIVCFTIFRGCGHFGQVT